MNSTFGPRPRKEVWNSVGVTLDAQLPSSFLIDLDVNKNEMIVHVYAQLCTFIYNNDLACYINAHYIPLHYHAFQSSMKCCPSSHLSRRHLPCFPRVLRHWTSCSDGWSCLLSELDLESSLVTTSRDKTAIFRGSNRLKNQCGTGCGFRDRHFHLSKSWAVDVK